ncbi:MAG TPA: class I SAM-dependent methyltransferase [Planctomycetota bacterium]|nr:class I SAM-dependent methyltransferase [Planctomycetota bacterium]
MSGETSCPVCGGAASRAFRARGVPPGSEFFVVRCGSCGFGWTTPVLGDEEIGAFYPRAYYGARNVRFNPLMESLVRVFRRRRASVIARLAAPGRVLDVGCGRGLILENLRARGFEVSGTELSDAAATHARAAGIPVHVGPLETAPHAEGSLGAVIFWHSLEHIRSPLEAVARARALLAPEGLLVVAVPNSDSLQARLTRSNWFHLDVPRHYVHFGTRSLLLALEKAGFQVRAVSHFALEQNPYGWLQSLYNALGFEWNLLYAALKNPSARDVPLRRRPLELAILFLLLPILFPVALALWAVEVALRRGGTIDVYATKR